ncbi:beta-galactosidase [Capsulimonas corticalis]|uniref:Beta-galactosidase n=1 Tax=Capsulimonas corticalis TaxID=2219043 RepID=A0A402D692_9BACT|nr:beta-galactosidase family protein [Capsulimonas corticalis]BDI32064.1 beta-galactosidase [Capsulimonas corticalis]
MKKFEITPAGFRYDGQPIQIISGAMHYFRIVPEYWEDRLLKLKACGMNAVETYVAWNAHEPRPGEFRFDGILDLVRFIQIAARLDLLVIVRPSPYICAEWDFGGLPAWLLADPGMKVRCMHAPYLAAVDRYYDRLLPMLAPLQCTQGGPIIAMQVENEYGSYGADHEYLRFLERAMQSRGIDVPLFTSDGPSDGMLQGGALPGVFKTVNFGSGSVEAFRKLREYQPAGPRMCMEFWNGWFDHWGEPHHTRDAADAAQNLEEILAAGASVNAYMFHGGSNFGFSSGANFDGAYQPTVTSYDYDAPLDEAGDPTPKYYAFRDTIARYRDLPETAIPAKSVKKRFGVLKVKEQALLFEQLPNLAKPIQRTTPETMEALGQNAGFILYRTRVTGPRTAEPLTIQNVHDRAIVFLDGAIQGTIDRNDKTQDAIKLDIPIGGATLEILVENMGRINYGPHLMDRKGITEGVRLYGQFLHHWEIFCLPMDNLESLQFGPVSATDQPAFHRATFEIDTPADTFVALDGWTKGVCFVNGFNLGRYWDMDPRRNLYLPGPLLRSGVNEIVLFELHGCAGAAEIALVDTAEFPRIVFVAPHAPERSAALEFIA